MEFEKANRQHQHRPSWIVQCVRAQATCRQHISWRPAVESAAATLHERSAATRQDADSRRRDNSRSQRIKHVGVIVQYDWCGVETPALALHSTWRQRTAPRLHTWARERTPPRKIFWCEEKCEFESGVARNALHHTQPTRTAALCPTRTSRGRAGVAARPPANDMSPRLIQGYSVECIWRVA